MGNLPTSLENEPLVDALFEVRLSAGAPLADILPGILYQSITPRPELKRLPAAEVPQAIRASNPGLLFAPIQSLESEGFVISIGDRSITISCKMPYPKWPAFKQQILKTISLISETKIAGKVERYSVKYVNIIPGTTIAEQLDKIKLSLNIGGLEVKSDHVELKVHHQDEGNIHIITVISGAQAQLYDGSLRNGLILDIDSIVNIDPIDFSHFNSKLEESVDCLRQENKKKFFDCLTEEALGDMGAKYD